MTDNTNDPHRHWDGQRWLRWSGTEWIPEPDSTATLSSPPAGIGPQPVASGPSKRPRRTILIAAVVVAVGIAVGVYFATKGGGRSGTSDTSGGGDAGSTAAFPTRAATCTIEMNVAVDITVNHDAELYSVIGTSSPLFNLSTQALIKFESLESQVGGNEAESQIIPTLQSLCSQAGNPILTQNQVSGMVAVAESGDAASLNEVTIFATGTDGK